MGATGKDREMKIKGKITISRPRGGKEKEIRIDLSDTDACLNKFLEVSIGLSEFAEILTGLSRVDCDIEVRGLQNIGKIREHKTFEFELPRDELGNVRKEMAKTVLSNIIPEGWSSTDAFNSQGSFFYKDGTPWARAIIVRWVDKQPGTN